MNKDSLFRDDLFRGRRILVTGGGTGIGRAIAAKYAALGATVWICGRRAEVLEDTAAALTKAGIGIVKAIAVDIRDADAVEAMFSTIWADGPLSGLVNNAAGNFSSPTQAISSRGFDAISRTALHGTFYVTNAVGKRWISEGIRGSIISILTTWIWTGSPFNVPLTMSKAGLDGMTKSLAVEWGRYGIRLNAIAPGLFPTEGALTHLELGEDPLASGVDNPMGRLGRLEELQNLAAFLMADGCDWLTGQTIGIDGAGHLAQGSQFGRLSSLTEADWVRKRELSKARDASPTGPIDN